jgi:hypothetical protein
MTYRPEIDQATPEEDAASAAGLDLAPWVAPQAAAIRRQHLEQRAAESETASAVKAANWRRGACEPRGGNHRQ